MAASASASANNNFFKVQDNVFIGLSINGTAIPIQAGGFRRLLITCSQDAYVPAMEITLFDTHQLFSKLVTLADGLPVQLQIGPSTASFSIMNFRIFKFNQVSEKGVSAYHIRCYADHPKWFIETANSVLTLTSFSAIKSIAEECGMDFEGHTTNDKMPWLPKNERRCVFANRIAKHGFGSSTSFMRLAVDPGTNGKNLVRYVDLNKYDPRKPGVALFSQMDTAQKPGVFQIIDSRNISRSGFANATGGYKSKIISQSVFGEVAHLVKDKMGAKRMSNNLMMSTDVRSKIGESKVEFRPIDCGNVHPSYDEAMYRGKRSASVFSLGIEMLINTRTALRLLDPINVKMIQSPGAEAPSENKSTSGYYIVTARSILIEVGNYFEKIQAFTTGINDDLSANGKQV